MDEFYNIFNSYINSFATYFNTNELITLYTTQCNQISEDINQVMDNKYIHEIDQYSDCLKEFSYSSMTYLYNSINYK